MPAQPLHALVLSQRGLIRELMGDLLLKQLDARIIGRCGSFDEAIALAHAAQVLVCDVNGVPADALAAFLERLRAQHPTLRVVTIDDSLGSCDIESIVRAVRASDRPAASPHEQLTPLECEVMLAVAAGSRNADIARRMRRSCKTVEKHRANALRKLGFRNVAQLTAYAIRHRLLDPNTILVPRER